MPPENTASQAKGMAPHAPAAPDKVEVGADVWLSGKAQINYFKARASADMLSAFAFTVTSATGLKWKPWKAPG